MSGLPPVLSDAVREALRVEASGPCFMRSYPAHTAHFIKQNDEARSGTPIAITDDGELANLLLKPSTTYLVLVGLSLSTAGTPTNMIWRPACTQAVDFASFLHHRKISSTAAEFWSTGSAGDSNNNFMNTTEFNASNNFVLADAGGHRAYGMIRTSSSGGFFSIQWGNSNTSGTMRAGSFVYLREVPDSSIIIKQNDESRQSNTTMTDDGELTIALDAGSTYFIDAALLAYSNATADLKLSFVYTGTITSVGLTEAAVTVAASNSGGAGDALSRAYHLGAGTNLTTPTVRTRSGNATAGTVGGGHIRGVIVTNTSGNLKIQWAQSVSTAVNTTAYKGSYIYAQKTSDLPGQFVYKTSDESRSSTTVLANDTDLVLTTRANKKYIVENFTVHDCASGTPDSKYAIYDPQATVSLGVGNRVNLKAQGSFGVGSDLALFSSWHTAAWITTPTNATPTTSGTANKNAFSITWCQQQGGSDSNVAVQWCQNVSSGTAVIMRAGSWIWSEEVIQP